jgi:uncharacterized phage protein (TIGR01671 family)
MMRELKFRAWIPKEHWISEKEQKPSGYIEYDWQNKIWMESVDFQPDAEAGIILMQFTGLTDMNGKDIYEGDIIEADTIEDCDKGRVVFRPETASFMIVFDNESEFLYDINSPLVIGNIYEHPELLNNSKEPTTKKV